MDLQLCINIIIITSHYYYMHNYYDNQPWLTIVLQPSFELRFLLKILCHWTKKELIPSKHLKICTYCYIIVKFTHPTILNKVMTLKSRCNSFHLFTHFFIWFDKKKSESMMETRWRLWNNCSVIKVGLTLSKHLKNFSLLWAFLYLYINLFKTFISKSNFDAELCKHSPFELSFCKISLWLSFICNKEYDHTLLRPNTPQ